MEKKYIIGIDEAGRGPIAGPVSVGAFGAEEKVGKWIIKNLFQGKLRDSKKLSPTKREEIYKKLVALKKQNKVYFAVTHVSNQIIDKRGISYAVRKGINSVLEKLSPSPNPLPKGEGTKNQKTEIRLDGLLKAPEEYKNQKTIIKGDEKDVFIACASIVAKVSRDRLMCKLAPKYPHYSFEIHKGYGTAPHRSLIYKLGLSAIHRHTFCKSILINSKS